MVSTNNKFCGSSGSIVIKICYAILFILCAGMTCIFFIGPDSIINHFGWREIILIITFAIPIIFARKKPENSLQEKKLEWKTLDRNGKIYWAIVIAVWVGAILFAILGGIILPMISKYIGTHY